MTFGLILLAAAAAAAAIFITFEVVEYTDDYWPAFWWLPLISGLAFTAWIVDHALDFLAG
jgi:hypothetical protein